MHLPRSIEISALIQKNQSVGHWGSVVYAAPGTLQGAGSLWTASWSTYFDNDLIDATAVGERTIPHFFGSELEELCHVEQDGQQDDRQDVAGYPETDGRGFRQ